jgi:hypothetical protein
MADIITPTTTLVEGCSKKRTRPNPKQRAALKRKEEA